MTPNPTAPTIDLDALASDLEAAGWDITEETHVDDSRSILATRGFSYGRKKSKPRVHVEFTIWDDGVAAMGQAYDSDPEPTDLTPEVWHALDIIRTHTNGATR